MQLFEIYNFSSKINAPRSGHQGHFSQKLTKFHGFHAVGPLVAPPGDKSPDWSSLENIHIDATFRDLQLFQQDQRSPEWPSGSFQSKTDQIPWISRCWTPCNSSRRQKSRVVQSGKY